MTAAQKTAKLKFKQAIAYRQKTGVTLKEAFAHIYGKKVGAVKKKAAPKKKVGALPVGFKGSVWDTSFKIVNQYDIYNDVSAIVEDVNTGSTIVIFDGKGKATDKADQFTGYIINNSKNKYNDKDKLAIKSRLIKFSNLMQKEVKDFNAGKKKTIKKAPLKIPAPKNIITTKKRLPSVIKLINKSINKVYKQSKKKAPKKVAKRKLSNIAIDRQRQALPAGKRISKSGKVYYENRENRMDRGKLLGINDITLTRINNDLNGNPRYVVHFLNVLNSEEQSFLPFNKKYEYALKKAKLIGGKKYDNKQYGGGIVFGSIFNSEALKQKINNLMQTNPKIKY